MKNLMLIVVALTAFAGCGPAADNVGACNRWKTAVKCGSGSNAGVDAISCSSYSTLACDISGYFDCLSTAYVCVNGQYDTTKAGNAAACASKAVCK